MSILWAVIGVALLATYMYLIYSRGSRRVANQVQPQRAPERDLGANINPSQTGNEKDLWPDRTGARTRRELGARHAADVTYVGDREEHKGEQAREALSAGIGRPPAMPATTDAPPVQVAGPGGGRMTDGNHPPTPATPGVRREVQPGTPDQPPTQWNPEDHGAPGDHIRAGHHRSATAPERHSTSTDPYAHAPVPGPNHVPPPGGQDLPPNTNP